MELSYLTRDLPGTGGLIKHEPEDFHVDELPLYEPCGEGEHVYVRIWKRGLPTFEAMRRIASELDVPEAKVAHAGLKDARAVTTQWLSIEGTDEDRVRALDLEKIRVLAVARHGNKLKLGHLRGNRFSIVIRNTDAGALERAAAILDALVRRGAPNYFGPQRFGTRGDSHLCGEKLLRRDYAGFVQQLLGGDPGEERDPYLLNARRLFNEGKLTEALKAMPMRRRTEKKCLHALIRFEDPERAAFAVPMRMRRLYGAAYQSRLFNRVLDQRIDRIDRLEAGDLAMLHRNGACFRVEDLAAEQPRCHAFEISPTGPMFGSKTQFAEGEPGARERTLLEETGLEPRDFAAGGLKLRGVRRSLRLPLRNVVLEQEDECALRIEFELPAGSFATSVIREITK